MSPKHTIEHHDHQNAPCRTCGQDAPSDVGASTPDYWVCTDCMDHEDAGE